jgi:PAS domain S-box-containing protein
MPHTDDPRRKIEELEGTIRILQGENEQLAERAEDTLLIGLITGQIGSASDIGQVLERGLEQVSVLKGIPLCACCSLEGSKAHIIKSYLSFSEENLNGSTIILPQRIMEKLVDGDGILQGAECRTAGFSIDLHKGAFVPRAMLCLPLRSRYAGVNLLLFSDDSSDDRLPSVTDMLNRVTEIISSKIDNICLFQELQAANRGLDLKVEERTRELRESENRFRLFFENEPAYCYMISPEGRILDVNKSALAALGYRKEDLIGKPVRTIYAPESHGKMQECFERWKETRTLSNVEMVILTGLGEKRTVLLNANMMCDANGRTLHSISVQQDITDIKRAEEALRESERKYRIVADNTYDWEFWEDPDGHFLYTSPSCLRVTGHAPQEFLADPGLLERIIRPEDRARYGEHASRMRTSTHPGEIEFRIILPDGTERWIGHVCQAVMDEQGRSIGRRGSNRDITVSKTAEEELRKLSSAIDQSPLSIVITDAQGTIEFVNPRFTEITGYGLEESRGKNPRILQSGKTPPEVYAALWSTITSGKVWKGTFCNRKKNGDLFYEEATIAPVKNDSGATTHFIAIKEDITGKMLLEDQLRQAQKMEAIGTLAGGIAHDFNNLLTVIIGYGNILKMKMRPDDPLRVPVDQILESSERAAHLTHGLLAFSRKQVISPRPVDLNDIVRNVEKLLRRIIGEDVAMATNLTDKGLIVMADPVQIEQVLMNFATNARDAMPQGGSLTISTSEVELGEDFVAARGFGKSGAHALIAVSDTGQGMDEETREHIFDPFFTTKEPGKGTGLGLAIVYGIVKQHNGNITVYSDPGKGTTFNICLPLMVTVGEKEEQQPVAPLQGGTETILLAEDEREVRDLTAMVLREYGYTVVEAVDGQDAVEKFTAYPGKIDLLVLDVIMPRKSGKDAFDAIKMLGPETPVLFVSGYTADILREKGITEEGIAFVAKPVRHFDLLRKMREILDRMSRKR